MTENSRKHANLGTYEMTDPTEVLEKSAEDFAAQVHESSIALAPRYRLFFRHSFIPFFSVDTQVSSLKRLLEECERKSGDLGLEIANFIFVWAINMTPVFLKELRTVTKLGAESDAQQRRLRERAETLLDLCARYFIFFTFTFFLRLFTIGASLRYPDLGPAPRELTDAAKGAIDADAATIRPVMQSRRWAGLTDFFHILLASS